MFQNQFLINLESHYQRKTRWSKTPPNTTVVKADTEKAHTWIQTRHTDWLVRGQHTEKMTKNESNDNLLILINWKPLSDQIKQKEKLNEWQMHWNDIQELHAHAVKTETVQSTMAVQVKNDLHTYTGSINMLLSPHTHAITIHKHTLGYGKKPQIVTLTHYIH